LNVAPPSLLKNLNSENLFRVIAKQLPNNWTYYWFEKRKNGKDPKKWLESLEELYNDDNGRVMDLCYRNIYGAAFAGVFRTNEHLNLVLKQKVREGRPYDAAIHFDYLRRGNRKTTDPVEAKKYTINRESWDLTAMIFLDLKEYELCKCIVDAIDNDHKKIIDLSDEVKKKN